MGLDAKAGGRVKLNVKKNTRSSNLYLHLLIKLFRFLSRRTESNFVKTVLRRLLHSNVQRSPISISRILAHLKGSKVVVHVGTVTDDVRTLTVPKLQVVALRFTETARARIQKAGGKCMTFDELVQTNPTGAGVLLVRGNKKREARTHFGAAGIKRSKAKPYTRSSKVKENKPGIV